MSSSSAGNHNRPTITQACASCKYQRRKCGAHCLLAQFSPSRHGQDDFLNAHKLIGILNILKMTKNLDPAAKANALKTLIYEANELASSDPVGGCYRIVSNLERYIMLCLIEYNDLLLHQLAVCRVKLAPPIVIHDDDKSINMDAPASKYVKRLILKRKNKSNAASFDFG